MTLMRLRWTLTAAAVAALAPRWQPRSLGQTDIKTQVPLGIGTWQAGNRLLYDYSRRECRGCCGDECPAHAQMLHFLIFRSSVVSSTRTRSSRLCRGGGIGLLCWRGSLCAICRDVLQLCAQLEQLFFSSNVMYCETILCQRSGLALIALPPASPAAGNRLAY